MLLGLLNKVLISLDECLLDENNEVVGASLLDNAAAAQKKIEIMKNLFRHEENSETGKNILLANRINWNSEE
jgi:hypothetical protein